MSVKMYDSLPSQGLRYLGGAVMQLRIKDYVSESNDAVVIVNEDNFVTGSANIENVGINTTKNVISVTYALFGYSPHNITQSSQQVFFKKRNATSWTQIYLDSSAPFYIFDTNTFSWITSTPSLRLPPYNSIVGRLTTDDPVLFELPTCSCTYAQTGFGNTYYSDNTIFAGFASNFTQSLFQRCTYTPQFGQCMIYLDVVDIYAKCGRQVEDVLSPLPRTLLDSEIASCEIQKGFSFEKSPKTPPSAPQQPSPPYPFPPPIEPPATPKDEPPIPLPPLSKPPSSPIPNTPPLAETPSPSPPAIPYPAPNKPPVPVIISPAPNESPVPIIPSPAPNEPPVPVKPPPSIPPPLSPTTPFVAFPPFSPPFLSNWSTVCVINTNRGLKYREYVEPYLEMGANDILKLLRFVGGYRQTTPSLTDTVVERIQFCADTNNNSVIEANDILLHLRTLSGFAIPRQSL